MPHGGGGTQFVKYSIPWKGMSLHLASKTLIVSSGSNSRHHRPLDIGPLIAGVNILPENAIASQNLANVELERCKPLLPAMWECLDQTQYSTNVQKRQEIPLRGLSFLPPPEGRWVSRKDF